MSESIPLLKASLTIARALGTYTTVERAATPILKVLCQALKLDVGVLWLVDPRTHRLRYVRSWSPQASRARLFATACTGVTFHRGEGLPGSVWRRGRPMWISEIARDPNFPRFLVAAATGLVSAVAVPIRIHGEVQGVVEFLSSTRRPRHPEMLSVIADIGTQIGLFADRCELKQALERSNRDLRAANARLALLASRDPLTGLFNRRTFLHRLELAASRAAQQGRSFCLALLDIDHFKQVNDTLGHEKGDEVLRRIAVTLRKSVRKGDTVARYGGEEFAILFAGCGLERAAELSDSVRKRVERISGPWKPLTVSLGVAAYDPGQPELDHVVRQADEALYRAKDAGRNRVETAKRKRGRAGPT